MQIIIVRGLEVSKVYIVRGRCCWQGEEMCAVSASECYAHPSTRCCLEINSENSVNFNEGRAITVMWEENQLCVCTLCNPEVLGGGLHVFY